VQTVKPADFGDYIRANGGCGGRRVDRPLSVARCEAPGLTRYGERFLIPFGVRCYGQRVTSTETGELALEAPAESVLEIHRDVWRVVAFAPAPRTVKVTGPSSGAAGALESLPDATAPPETVPRVAGPAPPSVPLDSLDQDLQRECDALGGSLARFWYWPRSSTIAGASRRPPSADELADRAALAADLARLGPIPA
jgi:hypothetical protein